MKTQSVLTRFATAAALAMGLGVAASSAQAQLWIGPDHGRGTAPHAGAAGNIVDVQIRVDGQTAPLYFQPGVTDRHYFQAFQGRNYSVVLHNTTDARIGVVIAVDGLNVVDGQHTDLGRTSPMYVLDPYETATINGWRTSTEEVRRFVFVDEDRSYATRTGQANGDMGWIRVAAYREIPVQTWVPPYRVRRDMGGAPSPAPNMDELQGKPQAAPQGAQKSLDRRSYSENMAPEEDSSPGTGWGNRQWDPVQTTQFVAERSASDWITLRYEYASGLKALGIVPRHPRVWEREQGQYGFAQPPRW